MKTALIPFAEGFEDIEAITITDILVRGGVQVTRASLNDHLLVTASRGTQVMTQTSLTKVEMQSFDLIALPGGLPGADYLNQDARLIKMLQAQAEAGRWVAAICAAPQVLVTAGLLNDKKATSYPGVIDQHPAPGMQYLDEPVVAEGNIITSRGPGTAMDFALTLVERLQGQNLRQEVEAALVRR